MVADGSAIQDYLQTKTETKVRTVPRIFVATEILGGSKEGGGRSDLDASMKPGAKEPLDDHWLDMAVKYTAAHSA